MSEGLRNKLISIILEWEREYGVAPAITSALSEYDAAMLLGLSEREYSESMEGRTAVSKNYDFKFQGERYQVKANRPSGKPGSHVTKVPDINNYEWDWLIWILYNRKYEIQEAWQWDVIDCMDQFKGKARITPDDMRKGKRLFPE